VASERGVAHISQHEVRHLCFWLKKVHLPHVHDPCALSRRYPLRVLSSDDVAGDTFPCGRVRLRLCGRVGRTVLLWSSLACPFVLQSAKTSTGDGLLEGFAESVDLTVSELVSCEEGVLVAGCDEQFLCLYGLTLEGVSEPEDRTAMALGGPFGTGSE
jgi:hypothetical protein